MPTKTQLTRDGQPLAIKWSFWTLACLTKARAIELGVEEETVPTFPSDPYTFTQAHAFADKDETTGAVSDFLEIRPGDVYHAWRERY